MSKFMYVSECGDGVVVEAAVEGPKKAAAHVVGAARGSRGGIDASRRAAARPAPQACPTAPNVPLRTAGDKHRIVGGPAIRFGGWQKNARGPWPRAAQSAAEAARDHDAYFKTAQRRGAASRQQRPRQPRG